MAQGRLLLLFVTLYVILALAYIAVTPYRTPGWLPLQTAEKQKDIGAPDERQHVNYIRHLARGKGFPIFDPDAPDFYETYQSHQPPLYYLLSAPVSFLVADNEPIEKWALRLINVLLGVGLILLVRQTILCFTGNDAVAVFCAGFLAFLPMFLALSTAVTNDVLLYFMIVLALYSIALGWKDGWTWKRCMFLGVILGFGLLAKTTFLVVIPAVLVGMIAFPTHKAPFHRILATFAVTTAIASPWLIRNHLLYGDPFAMTAFQQAFKTLPASAIIEREGAFTYWVEAVGYRAVWGFWGIFGYFQITMEETLYLGLTAAAAICCAGLIWRLFAKPPPAELRMHVINATLLLTVLLVFVRFNMVYYQAQARYLYPAIFSLLCAIGFGLWQMSALGKPNLKFWTFAGLFLAMLIVVNVYCVSILLPKSFYILINYDKIVEGNLGE